MMEDLSPGVAASPVGNEAVDEHNRHLHRIKRAIRRKTSGGVRELKVERREDAVLLRGQCNSYYCKQIAQTAAMLYLNGGQQLCNEIEVVVPLH